MITLLSDEEAVIASKLAYLRFDVVYRFFYGHDLPDELARRWWPKAFDTAPAVVLDLDTERED
jgi:hypothetical protein